MAEPFIPSIHPIYPLKKTTEEVNTMIPKIMVPLISFLVGTRNKEVDKRLFKLFTPEAREVLHALDERSLNTSEAAEQWFHMVVHPA